MTSYLSPFRRSGGHRALASLITILAVFTGLTFAGDARAQNDDDARPRPGPRAPERERETNDDDFPSYALSVNGPGAGKTQGSLGLGFAYLRGGLVAPGLELGVVHGIHDIVDFRLFAQLAIITGGNSTALYGTVDPHFLFRLTGQRIAMANVGLKLGPEVNYVVSDGGLALFGVTPGLVASFGASKLQATLGVDFPIFFAVAGTFNGTGTSAAIRPGFGIEGNIAGDTNLFLKVAPTISFEAGFSNVALFAGVNF